MVDVLLVCGEGEEVENVIREIEKNGFGYKRLNLARQKYVGADNEANDEIFVGGGGSLLDIFRESQAKKIAFIGSFAGVKIEDIHPDLLVQDFLQKSSITPRSLMDWLRVVNKMLAANGVSVAKIHDLTGSVTTLRRGFVTKAKWNLQDQSDFVNGRRIQNALNNFGIGEVVVVRNGSIIGIEAENEGTDDVLRRIPRAHSAPSGVMVKWPLFDQSAKVVSEPVPTIGLTTLKLIKAAGLSGVIVHPVTQVWNEKEIIEYSDENQLFILVETEDHKVASPVVK